MGNRQIGKAFGITALVFACASIICIPASTYFAFIAIVLGIIAIVLGTRALGIASIIVSVIVIATWLLIAYILGRTAQEIVRMGQEYEKQTGRIIEQMREEMAKRCIYCGGKGVVDCPLCVNGRLPNGAICSQCKGYGVFRCSYCKGTGKAQ